MQRIPKKTERDGWINSVEGGVGRVKISVMMVKDYMAAGGKHTKEDIEVDEKELRGIERKVNAAVLLFIKIFKMGEGADQVERHRANLITHSRNPSSMKLLHKDNKEGSEVQTRRLNGPGLNVGLSNLISEILEPIAGEMSHKVERGSTENTLRETLKKRPKLGTFAKTLMAPPPPSELGTP